MFARFFGYLKYVVIAVLFGFNMKTDAFFMALSLIGIFMMFTDVFNSLGVPQLVAAKQKDLDLIEFKKIASMLLTLTIALTVVITLAAIFIYPLIAKIAIGFHNTSLMYMKNVYYLLLPYLSLNFIFHYCGGVLRSMRRFTQYFIGEFIFSFFSFLFTFLGLHYFKSYLVLPSALSIAQVFSTLYMIFIAKEFLHFGFFINDTIKQIFTQFGYLSLLYGTFYMFLVIDKSFASLLPAKSISALTYGVLVASIPVSILRLDHFITTTLSEHQGSLEKLNFYIKKILLISIPIIIFYLLFSGLLVRLLFFYGSFSKSDLKLTTKAVMFFSLNIPAMLIWPLINRVFQIKNKLKPAFIIAMIGIIINFLLDYLFVIKLQMTIKGIILGTIVTFLIMCIASLMFLYNNSKNVI